MSRPAPKSPALALAAAAAFAALLFPAPSAAKWKEKTVKDWRLINLCSSMHDDQVVEASEGDYRGAKVFSNKGAEVVFCYYDQPKGGWTDHQYLIKYIPPKEKKFTELHSDAEVMAWGAEVTTKKEVLTVKLTWPSEKGGRKVREFTVDCTKKCEIAEKCEIQKLKTDIKTKDLLEYIKKKVQKEEDRGEFVMSANGTHRRRMYQLFMEALAGNAEAKTLLDKFSDSGSAAGSEIAGTYSMYVDDLKSKNCKWK